MWTSTGAASSSWKTWLPEATRSTQHACPVLTIEAALGYLHALPRFADRGAAAYHPGLARMEALMAAMGDPHQAFRSIHVAGTNGKGSTASMIAAVGTAAGRRVGLHTSPHLFHLSERMRVDGVPAPDDWLAAAVARYHGTIDAVRPSFFEATVALSFRYFADAGVDDAVVEVGLGGRLDATNVLRPAVAVITHIGLDHTELLGDTLSLIAREKAGIIKPGVPVVVAAEQPDVLAVLREAAREREAPFHVAPDEARLHGLREEVDGLTLHVETPLRRYDELFAGLPGLHQSANAQLALRAAELAYAEVRRGPAAVYAGLRDVRRLAGLRGRLDVLHRHPLVVADVAHNPDGLGAALAFTRSRIGAGGRLHVLFGAMRDKDVAAMAHLLAGAGAVVTPVPIPGERALAAEELAGLLARFSVLVAPARSAPDGLAHFLRSASPLDALLISGSHQVVAQLPESGFAPNANFP